MIREIMTYNIISGNKDNTFKDISLLMKKHNIGFIPIKDKDEYIGILSLSDILNYTNNNNIINTYKTIFYIHDNDHSTIAEIDEFYL